VFHEALTAGTMAGYFALAEQFHTQADPAFCGLGTLVMVLNALAIDPGPGRSWKGPWRWFAEEHLDCCRPLSDIEQNGLTIPQVACLARCNGARVEIQYAQATNSEAFRQAVRKAASTAGEPHLVLSYDRATLNQTGGGHFSPMGGYHVGRDLVLILDVARFKYPPHWVPLEDLFRAMLSNDAATSRSRGFLQFFRHSEVASLCPLDGRIVRRTACGATCAST
jgi:glutathione gamma-glutamylcysteinyltransferase